MIHDTQPADRALPQGLNIFLVGVLFCGCKKSFVCLLEIVGSRCMLSTGHAQLSEGKCGSDAKVVKELFNFRQPARRAIHILRAWCASENPIGAQEANWSPAVARQLLEGTSAKAPNGRVHMLARNNRPSFFKGRQRGGTSGPAAEHLDDILVAGATAIIDINNQ